MFESLLSSIQAGAGSFANMAIFGTEALAIAFVTILLAGLVKRLLPRVSSKVDSMVMGGRIDLPPYVHEAIEKTIVYGIYLVGLYAILFVSAIPNPFNNRFFQLVVLWASIKIVLEVTPSAINEIDKMSPIKMSRHSKVLLKSLVRYLMYAAFIVGTMTILGYTRVFTAALAGAGVAGLAIGFATKDVLSNAIAGLMLIFDRPFRIGDSIMIKDMSGTVKEIALRTTTIKTFDGKIIMMPNSMLSTNPITNYTANKIRRFDVPVGVAYKTDLSKANKVILDSLKKIDGLVINDSKPALVIVDGFADSSINLTVRFWADTRKGYYDIMNGVHNAINDSLAKAKIEIPFPQIVVNKG